MRGRLVALAAGALLIASPTAAQAADNYLFGVTSGADRINAPGTVLPTQSIRDFSSAGLTTQANLFTPGPGGGPAEPLSGCPFSNMVSTHWSEFFPNKTGQATIYVAGNFDIQIRVLPFNQSTNAPDIAGGSACVDARTAGAAERVTIPVTAGQGYKLQVGGLSGAGTTTGVFSELIFYEPNPDPIVSTPVPDPPKKPKKCKKKKSKKSAAAAKKKRCGKKK